MGKLKSSSNLNRLVKSFILLNDCLKISNQQNKQYSNLDSRFAK